MNRDDQLDLLEHRVRTCELCALSQTRRQAVPGEGPLTAEVMLIGEAPGANEDAQGRPFVGAAGSFLRELLEEAGLRREDVYICNVLKCRPPGNRDPLPTEIDACDPYLEEQIHLLDPLVIVTLGRFSMGRFFRNARISQIHGRPRRVEGRLVVPMFHPAAALHREALRETILEDFRELRDVIEQARQERTEEAPAPEPAPPPVSPPAPSNGDGQQMSLF